MRICNMRWNLEVEMIITDSSAREWLKKKISNVVGTHIKKKIDELSESDGKWGLNDEKRHI